MHSKEYIQDLKKKYEEISKEYKKKMQEIKNLYDWHDQHREEDIKEQNDKKSQELDSIIKSYVAAIENHKNAIIKNLMERLNDPNLSQIDKDFIISEFLKRIKANDWDGAADFIGYN